MAGQPVIAAVRRYLGALEAAGILVSFAVLYGSQATGLAVEESDIDLVVVSPRFDGVTRRADFYLLWEVAARVDGRIEPVPCGERQWRSDQHTPLIQAARLTGQVVEPAPRDSSRPA